MQDDPFKITKLRFAFAMAESLTFLEIVLQYTTQKQKQFLLKN